RAFRGAAVEAEEAHFRQRVGGDAAAPGLEHPDELAGDEDAARVREDHDRARAGCATVAEVRGELAVGDLAVRVARLIRTADGVEVADVERRAARADELVAPAPDVLVLGGVSAVDDED